MREKTSVIPVRLTKAMLKKIEDFLPHCSLENRSALIREAIQHYLGRLKQVKSEIVKRKIKSGCEVFCMACGKNFSVLKYAGYDKDIEGRKNHLCVDCARKIGS